MCPRQEFLTPPQAEARLYCRQETPSCLQRPVANFASAQGEKPSRSLIPPPNAWTGSLHMGPRVQQTLQDHFCCAGTACAGSTRCAARSDHAGIATQIGVERAALPKHGKAPDRFQPAKKFHPKSLEQKASPGHGISASSNRLMAPRLICRAMRSSMS